MNSTSQRVVGISEMIVSCDPDDVLITYSLGSCLGLTLFDTKIGAGGLLHAMMPLSTADPVKAMANPAMYADTGVRAMLQALFDLGATRRTIVARVAGGAAQMDGLGLFRIGERNEMVVRKLLWKNDILISGSDVGGGASRTMVLEIASGRTFVKTGTATVEL